MSSFVRNFIKHNLVALTIKIGGAALSYLMFVGLARSMSIAEFGIFSMAFSTSVVLAKIAVGGQQQIALRDLARLSGQHDSDPAAGAIVARAMLVVLVLSAVLIAGLLGVAAFARTPAMVWALVVAAAFIPAMAVSELQTSVLRAFGALVRGIAPREIVWRGLVCVAGFGIAALWGRVLSAWEGFVLVLVLLAIPTAVQYLALPQKGRLREALARKPLQDRAWLTVSVQFWISSVVTFAAPMLSVVVIGIFLAPAAAGAFFAALKSAQAINLVLMATGIVASPLISRAFSNGDTRRIQVIGSLSAASGTIFALVALAVFVFFGEAALRLFGPGFESAYLPLIIMSSAYVVNAACGPKGTILEMTKHQDTFLRLILISNILGLVALPVLTWAYGAVGAAIDVAGTLILWNVLAARASDRLLGVDTSVLGLLRLLGRHDNDKRP